MFVGHYSAALAAAAHPKAPKLGTLFIAAQLIDFGFFGLLLTGAERMRLVPGFTAMNPMDLYHMPWTHSLAGAIIWAAAFGAIVWLWQKSRAAAVIAGAVVVSHWLLDLLVHAPDLTLWGSPPRLGLGLWNHPLIEMPLEMGLLLGGAWLYARATRGTGWPLPVLLVALFALQAFNWFGPPPERVDLAFSLLAFVGYGIAAGLAWWVARGRTRAA